MFAIPAPLKVSVPESAVIVNGLAVAANKMLLTSVWVRVTDTLVPAVTPNVAISFGPLGTVPGVQFEALFQLLLVGLDFHVALPAWVV